MALVERSRFAVLSPVLIAAAGLVYFGQYYRHGFNLGDEGALVLTTARLLAGELPYVSLDIGYGLLWFYPLVLLFKITGVDFLAARMFFMTLALVTALLAQRVVLRHTRSFLLPLAISLAVLTVPGTLHKTYVPLIVVANMAFVSALDWKQECPRWKWAFVWSLVVTLSYYIRSELGFCAFLVLLATLTIHALSRPTSWLRRAGILGGLSLPVLGGVAVPTIPLLLIAHRQGFLDSFVVALLQPLRTIEFLAAGLAAKLLAAVQSLSTSASISMTYAPVAAMVGAQAPPPRRIAQVGITLPRVPLAAAWEGGPQQIPALLTYLPLVALAIIVAFVGWQVASRWARNQRVLGTATAGLLAQAGLAYSAFPQFYSFRPDIQHLSQFMPGLIVLVGCCLGLWWWPRQADSPPDVGAGARAFAPSTKSSKVTGAVFGAFLALHMALYAWFGWNDPATGSIAIARGPSKSFHGANGVDVLVAPPVEELFETLTRVVETYTDEGDFMLCFPYCPGFNVIADRPTFAKRLYVDNSVAVMDPEWQSGMIAQIESETPSVIVLHDWAVNGTEVSRFQNWATDVTGHIYKEYEAVETLGGFTFFARKDRLRAQNKSE